MINMLYYSVLFGDIPAPEKAVIIKLIKRTNSTIDVIFDVSLLFPFGVFYTYMLHFFLFILSTIFLN